MYTEFPRGGKGAPWLDSCSWNKFLCVRLAKRGHDLFYLLTKERHTPETPPPDSHRGPSYSDSKPQMQDGVQWARLSLRSRFQKSKSRGPQLPPPTTPPP